MDMIMSFSARRKNGKRRLQALKPKIPNPKPAEKISEKGISLPVLDEAALKAEKDAFLQINVLSNDSHRDIRSGLLPGGGMWISTNFVSVKEMMQYLYYELLNGNKPLVESLPWGNKMRFGPGIRRFFDGYVKGNNSVRLKNIFEQMERYGWIKTESIPVAEVELPGVANGPSTRPKKELIFKKVLTGFSPEGLQIAQPWLISRIGIAISQMAERFSNWLSPPSNDPKKPVKRDALGWPIY